MPAIVPTRCGEIEGLQLEGVRGYLGVPYAEPPVGGLRFRRPRPVLPWSGIYQAKSFAKDPIQSNRYFGLDSYSEDCLYLNIWVPNHAGSGAPVMVWIPGGAFANGGSGAIKAEGPTLYDGRTLARETGCVVVSLSYRLNVYGFLNLSAYSNRFDDHLGMLDIVCALRWIQENIENFGGDSKNVTLFGESAGATAISVLMMIDEARPLFHKVIMQSNCFDSLYTPEESKEICDLFLAALGLDPAHAERLLECGHEQLLDAARQLDAHVLDHYTGRCTFCPVVDGKYIKGFPTLADLSENDKPVLIGSNRDEGNFQLLYVWDQPERYAPSLLRRLGNTQREALLATYNGFPGKTAFGELLTDTMYAFPKIRFAEHASRGKAQVFMYRYDYASDVMRQMGLDASHVAELLPLFEFPEGFFRQLYLGSEKEIHAIGLRMRAYWGSFARTGTPGMPGLVQWHPYTEAERNTLLIGLNDRLALDPEAEIRDRYKLFDRVLI